VPPPPDDIIDVQEKHHLISWTNWIFAGTPCHTQTPNPNWKDRVTLTFSIPRYGICWCSLL
jgi:hypothetical protein